jgi:hypothetical protein
MILAQDEASNISQAVMVVITTMSVSLDRLAEIPLTKPGVSLNIGPQGDACSLRCRQHLDRTSQVFDQAAHMKQSAFLRSPRYARLK